MAASSEIGFTKWFPAHLAVSFAMLIGLWNYHGWGLLNSAEDDGSGKAALFLIWLGIAVIWAIFVGIPLLKHILESDHFLAYAFFVLLVVAAAAYFATWNGLLHADNLAFFSYFSQFIGAVILAVSSAMASSS